jgi:hypothetical protein
MRRGYMMQNYTFMDLMLGEGNERSLLFQSVNVHDGLGMPECVGVWK